MVKVQLDLLVVLSVRGSSRFQQMELWVSGPWDKSEDVRQGS